MKNFKLHTSIKFVLFAFGLVMALAVLWINSTIISNLRDGNRRQIEGIAEVFSQKLSSDHSSDEEQIKDIEYVQKYINPILDNFEFPIIITDTENINEILSSKNIYAVNNIEISFDKNSPEYVIEIKKLIKQMNKSFVPYNITGTDAVGNKIVWNTIHYGDQKIIRTISLLPYLNFGFAILFIAIATFGVQLIRMNERNSIYAGMARETAHQLGTPISSLLGWVELLKERMLIKKRNKILSSMRYDLARLSEISDRFSKIGSKVHLKKISLKSLLEKVTMYMSERLPKSSKTSIILSIKKNVSLMGDPVLLSWAFENLIKNSIDATSNKEGKIIITLEKEGNQILLFFGDNGKGVARNNWNNIFRPGFSTKKRGWGLGLSLTERIIKDIHRGDISVVDSSKKGTTIKISFSNS